MGLAIALVILLITATSVGIFWARVWWFPVVISTHGAGIDRQFADADHYRDHFRFGPVGAGIFRLEISRSGG
jgi:hypothetical protein